MQRIYIGLILLGEFTLAIKQSFPGCYSGKTFNLQSYLSELSLCWYHLVTRSARTFTVIAGAKYFMWVEVFESSLAWMNSSLKKHANTSMCDLDRKRSMWEDGSIS